MSIPFHRLNGCVLPFLLSVLCLVYSAHLEASSSTVPTLKTPPALQEYVHDNFALQADESKIVASVIGQFHQSDIYATFQDVQRTLSGIDLSSNPSAKIEDLLSQEQIDHVVSQLYKILDNPLIKSLSKDIPTSREKILEYVDTIQERYTDLEHIKSFYAKVALPYIVEQHSRYKFSSFLSHLEKGLFELFSNGMVTKYYIRGNRLFVSIREQSSNKVYIFYQEDGSAIKEALDLSSEDLPIISTLSNNEKKIVNIYDTIHIAEIARNEKFNKNKTSLDLLNAALTKIEAQARMKGYDTTTVRLDRSGAILGIDMQDSPKFLNDPLRWFGEYINSIYEQPQFMIAMVATVVQCSVLALIYKFLKHETLASQVGPLVLTAVFSTFMGSFVGMYRNFIDSGRISKRILKESIIGTIFLYSFKILDSGLSSVSFLSLKGILLNIKLIGVMYLSKMFKYPYTFIPRKMNEFGAYGSEGQATVRFLGLDWNLKTLHNQLVYNVVSFGLKMAAVIGVYTDIALPGGVSVKIDIASVLFLTSPLIALAINGHWVRNQYATLLKKYLKDPSPTHKKGLQRREQTLEAVNRHKDRFRYWLYSVVGSLTGNFILKKMEYNLLHSPINSAYLSQTNSIEGLMELRSYVSSLLTQIENETDELKKDELIEEYVPLKMLLDKKMKKAATIRLARLRSTKRITKIATSSAMICTSVFSSAVGIIK